MSRTSDRLAALARVTDIAFFADQARMAALRRAEEDIRARLADLDRPRHDPTVPLAEDAALRAGADITWQLWVDVRRSALNTELARVLVAQAAARRTLSTSFGRDTAANRLRDRARHGDREWIEKRRERDGF